MIRSTTSLLRNVSIIGFTCAAALGAASPAAAIIVAPLDFEDAISGGWGGDNAVIPTTYGNDRGVSIVGNQGIQLFFERTGSNTAGDTTANPPTAASNAQGFVRDFGGLAWDTERAGYTGPGLGNFFMSSSGRPGGVAFPANVNRTLPFFSINYLRAPTQTIGGQIWDIDGLSNSQTEGWTVRAMNGNTMLDSRASGNYNNNGVNSLDGLPWNFSFNPSSLGSPVTRLDFIFNGNKTAGLGVAFGLFQSGVVPEPGTWAMMLAGFGLVGMNLRRKRMPVVAA